MWFTSHERQEIFRNLNNGEQEFLPFSNININDYIAMHKKDFIHFVDVCTGVKVKINKNEN